MPAVVLVLIIIAAIFIIIVAGSAMKNSVEIFPGVLVALSIFAILIAGVNLVHALYNCTDEKIIVEERIYKMQTVKKPDGGEMQVIVLDDGTTINMNTLFARSFKGGEMVHRIITRSKPTNGITWSQDMPKYELIRTPEREDQK